MPINKLSWYLCRKCKLLRVVKLVLKSYEARSIWMAPSQLTASPLTGYPTWITFSMEKMVSTSLLLIHNNKVNEFLPFKREIKTKQKQFLQQLENGLIIPFMSTIKLQAKVLFRSLNNFHRNITILFVVGISRISEYKKIYQKNLNLPVKIFWQNLK